MPIWPRKSGPIIKATPPKPSSTPATLAGVAFSSAVQRWATITPQIGVVALRIEARPLVIVSCAQTNIVKGTTLLSRARTRKDEAAPGGIASRSPRASRKIQSNAAARATRISTRVSGATVPTAISMKKKDPPQITDRSEQDRPIGAAHAPVHVHGAVSGWMPRRGRSVPKGGDGSRSCGELRVLEIEIAS